MAYHSTSGTATNTADLLLKLKDFLVTTCGWTLHDDGSAQADLDTATPGSELVLGDKAHNVTLSFWRRFTVPASTPVQNKTDLKLRITGVEAPV